MSKVAKIRLSTLFKTISTSLFSPFVSLYAINLGANNFQVGLISSLTTLASILAQFVGLPFTLSLRRKLVFNLIFDSIGALLFIPMAFVKEASTLILLLAIQAFCFSLPLQIWNEVQIRAFPKWKRGSEIGILNKISGLGSFIAYVFGGYLIRKYGFIYLVFFTASFLGITRNLILVGMEEDKVAFKSFRAAIREVISFKGFKETQFKRLLLARFVFNFAVSIGSPMFSVYLIKNLGADSIQLSIISTISLLVSVLFSEAWGRVADFIGRREVVLAGLPLIALFPLFYAISTNMIDIYIFTFIAQIGWVAFNIGMFSYLADISKESPQIYFVFHDAVAGISTIIASMLSGHLAEILGIRNVLILSFYLRIFSIFFFLPLGEKKGSIPRGLSPSASPHAIISSIESFISIYSLVFEETKKNVIERVLKEIGKILRRHVK